MPKRVRSIDFFNIGLLLLLVNRLALLLMYYPAARYVVAAMFLGSGVFAALFLVRWYREGVVRADDTEPEV